MSLDWFTELSYTYNIYTRILKCYKYNNFLQEEEAIAECKTSYNNILYPEGVKEELDFEITKEKCCFHDKCLKFFLKKDNNIISSVCKRQYILNIKLV
jgi:hypothetical protein